MNSKPTSNLPAVEYLSGLAPALDELDLQFAEQTPQPTQCQPANARSEPRTAGKRKLPIVAGAAVALVVGVLMVVKMMPPAAAVVAIPAATDSTTMAVVATESPARLVAPARFTAAPAWPSSSRPPPVRQDDVEAKGGQTAADDLRITTSKATRNPLLTRAFDALNADDLVAAEADYAAALMAEPRNPDALQGMAAVAVRRRQYEQAEVLYRQAVEADPSNAVAQAGLLGLQRPVDALVAESRLKSLIAAQPDQHLLRFALGNIYASSERWSEAQQEYFHAHVGDPQQPDYLFNLAVSLDRLHQPRQAAEYYALALAAAVRRPAEFDRADVSERLRELTE